MMAFARILRVIFLSPRNNIERKISYDATINEMKTASSDSNTTYYEETLCNIYRRILASARDREGVFGNKK